MEAPAMTGLRNRLVTEQDGRQHVSTVLIGADEIPGMLGAEETMHTLAGWDVRRHGAMLRCQKGTVVRWVWVRSRPVMEDTL